MRGVLPRGVLAGLCALLLVPAAPACGCGGGFYFPPPRTEALELLGVPVGKVTTGFLLTRYELDPLPKLALALVALLLVGIALGTARRAAGAAGPDHAKPVLRPFFAAAFGLFLPLALLGQLAVEAGRVPLFVFVESDLGFPGLALYYAGLATSLAAVPLALARLWTRRAASRPDGRVERGLAFMARRPFAAPLAGLLLMAFVAFMASNGPSHAASWLGG